MSDLDRTILDVSEKIRKDPNNKSLKIILDGLKSLIYNSPIYTVEQTPIDGEIVLGICETQCEFARYQICIYLYHDREVYIDKESMIYHVTYRGPGFYKIANDSEDDFPYVGALTKTISCNSWRRL